MTTARNLIMSMLLCCQVQLTTAAPGTFAEYLSEVRQRAISEGIRPETVDAAFEGLTPDARVIGFDRSQPEFVQTFEEYLAARVTAYRRQKGAELLRLHHDLLQRVSAHYAVEPEYIVAVWGLETNFGQYQGKYSIIRSLATLGHDPRRAAFFTAELISALRILDQGHVPAQQFVGGWAGAMGQSQFMPGSFLEYAEDFDGDGRKDIWRSEADVFASIANYLSKSGWQTGRGWGAEVKLPATFKQDALQVGPGDTRCRALRHHSQSMPLSEWRKQAVQWSAALPEGDYALLVPEPGGLSSYLVGGNYRAILRYNCANKYAVSVGLLADDLASQEST